LVIGDWGEKGTSNIEHTTSKWKRLKKLLLLGRDLCPKGPFEEETEPRMNSNERERGGSSRGGVEEELEGGMG
jgi:hypothetical protein